MKKIKTFLSISILVTLASCGGSDSNSVTLTVDPQLGQLVNFISISDNEATIKLIDEKEDGENVKSLVSSLSIKVNKSVASDYSFGLSVTVEDEDHIEISDLPSYHIDYDYDWDNGEFHYVIQPGSTRARMQESQTLQEWKEDDSQEQWNQICKRGKYLVVKPNSRSAKFIAYKGGGSSTVLQENIMEIPIEEIKTVSDETEEITGYDFEENSSAETMADLKEECEKALQQYKTLTKEALALAKKVKEGDTDANLELIQKTSECTAQATKIMDLAKKCDDPSIIVKYQKINADYIKDLQKYK